MRLVRGMFRELDRRAARLGPRRYAEAENPAALTVTVEDEDGTRRVVYGDDPQG